MTPDKSLPNLQHRDAVSPLRFDPRSGLQIANAKFRNNLLDESTALMRQIFPLLTCDIT
jgi:hypothetical protein